jgi:hypothetical protein
MTPRDALWADLLRPVRGGNKARRQYRRGGLARVVWTIFGAASPTLRVGMARWRFGLVWLAGASGWCEREPELPEPSLTLRDRLGNQLFLSHPLHGR